MEEHCKTPAAVEISKVGVDKSLGWVFPESNGEPLENILAISFAFSGPPT